MRNDNKKKDEILDEIEKNVPESKEFNRKELDILEQFSNDKDDMIRVRIAKILADFTESRGESILIKLAKDLDNVVRTEACDSLRYSESLETQAFLKKVAETDSDELVRGYAIDSVGDIALRIRNMDTVRKFLEERVKKENAVFPKINLYKVLYLLGKEDALTDLLTQFESDTYQDRCAVIHSLEDIVNIDNIELIKQGLMKQRKQEVSYAVITTIDDFLSRIEEEINY